VAAGRLGALALIFLLSGAGALVAETVWLRWLRGLLGATAPAASAALLAFFAGHAAGALWAARRAPRWRRPLLAWAGVEALAALGTAAVPLLLAAGEALIGMGYDALRARPAALAGLRFAVALVATLPAAVGWGASFPAVGAAALGAGRGLGSAGAALYGVNTFGAALGATLGAFVLPERLGVDGTWLVAIALAAAAAAGAWLLSRGERPVEAAAQAELAPVRGAGPGVGPAAVAALSGFGTLACQVVLVQALSQVLNQSVYAFGMVLVVVLLALALAAAAAAALSRRGVAARSALGFATVATALCLAAFPAAFFRLSDGLAFAGSGAPWPAYLLDALGMAALAAGPPLLAAGLVFPLALAWAAERAPEAPAGRLLGVLLAANTAGAGLGALCAPYLLLPALGTWGAFAALALAYAGAAFLLPETTPARRRLRIALLAGGWAAVFLSASPLQVPLLRLAPGESARSVRSTAAGVVAVIERGGERLIRTDNHYSLGGTGEILHQERQAHLPLLLHPRARAVVHAGSASGISAGALLAHPVERIWLVEIVPEVARAGERYFADANRGVHGDPRVEVVLDDAHNFLAHTRERFDVVIADLFVPWQAGAGALYTREHFEAVRERLEPGGLFCQWLPLYQLGAEEFHVILATFLDVFPEAGLFRGDFYGRFPIVALVGFRDGHAPAAEVGAAVARLRAAGERDRWLTDPAGFWSLYAGALGPLVPSLAQAPRNRQDRPVLEYLAARHHQGGTTGLARPFVGIEWQIFTDGVRAASPLGDPLHPDLEPAARAARAGGAALQMAGALWNEGRSGEASRAVAVAASLLPPHLLAAADPDPSAADLWPDPPSP
jgi:spermidine synthase